MIDEKLSKKVSVLFSRSIDDKLSEICHKTERTKSNLVRYIVEKSLKGNLKSS